MKNIYSESYKNINSAPANFDQDAEDKSSLGWCSPEFPAGCVQNESLDGSQKSE